MPFTTTQFRSPPLHCRVEPDTVHVWRAYYQATAAAVDKFEASLSAEEIEKARRFSRRSDRDRYVFAHGVLRSILGTYTGCSPHRLVFEAGLYEKPNLVSPGGGYDIQFNLSHSGDMTLIAVTCHTAVGIDIESMRRITDLSDMINRSFSSDEREYLNSLPPAEIEEGFFACWTAKEAFLKGIGEGLSYPLDRFSIVFSDGKPAGVKYIHDNSSRDNTWMIVGLSPGPGYAGALAIAKLNNTLKFFEYSED